MDDVVPLPGGAGFEGRRGGCLEEGPARVNRRAPGPRRRFDPLKKSLQACGERRLSLKPLPDDQAG